MRYKWLLGLGLLAGVAGVLIVAAQPSPALQSDDAKIYPWQLHPDDPRLGNPYPNAVVEQTEHDFGEMDVGASGTHTFVIRNAGPGGLRLDPGKTSCHCTSIQIEPYSVPPGAEARVTVEWHTTKPTENFRHGGWIKTDDPAHRQIRFTVIGAVRARLSSSPAEATFATSAQSDKVAAKTTLYTQVWDELEIEDVACESAAVAWRTVPTPPAVKAELKAKWAQNLIIEAGPGLPLGSFQTVLQVRARPKGDPTAEPIVREVTFQGEVAPDLSMAAPGYANGVLDLGMITEGRTVTGKLHVFIRGEHRDLDVAGITADPSFLRISMTRDEQAKGKAAHYIINITIPGDAPLAEFLEPTKRGQVRIELRHPTLSEIRFGLAFAIVPDPTNNLRRASAAVDAQETKQ